MSNSTVVLKPKKWVKIGYYIIAPFCLAMAVIVLYAYLVEGAGENTPLLFNLSLIISAVIILIGFTLSLPIFHRFHIKISETGVERTALKTKTIPYDSIRKISVGKGVVEVRGNSFMERISFGNLYSNFDEAATLLSEKVKGQDSITFKGSDKNLRAFLPQ